MSLEKGKTHIYTGSGKGKTTAAIGKRNISVFFKKGSANSNMPR